VIRGFPAYACQLFADEHINYPRAAKTCKH